MELPGRFLFAVDDGTCALEQLRADVELAAERGGASEPECGDGLRSGRGETFRLYLDGLATSLAVEPARAPDAALRAAHAFLALRREDAGGAWRVHELRGGARRLARELGLDVVDPARGAWARVARRRPAPRTRALAGSCAASACTSSATACWRSLRCRRLRGSAASSSCVWPSWRARSATERASACAYRRGAR